MTAETAQRCVICKSPIHEGAIKCIQCGSYQKPFYRFLSGIDVKSLVALIPIATLAFVFIKDQMITPRSDLKIASLDCKIDTITVAAANLGNRDALFAGVDLIRGDSIRIKMSLSAIPNSELLVPAGKTNIYELKAVGSDGSSLGLKFDDRDYCDYRLKIRALEFEQSIDTPKSICACPEK